MVAATPAVAGRRQLLLLDDVEAGARVDGLVEHRGLGEGETLVPFLGGYHALAPRSAPKKNLDDLGPPIILRIFFSQNLLI